VGSLTKGWSQLTTSSVFLLEGFAAEGLFFREGEEAEGLK
jgi:hypothetical protein